MTSVRPCLHFCVCVSTHIWVTATPMCFFKAELGGYVGANMLGREYHMFFYDMLTTRFFCACYVW